MIFSFSFASYGVSFADNPSQWPYTQNQVWNTGEKAPWTAAANVASETTKAVGSILAVLTGLVTLLLHPNWYNGWLFGINTYLHEVWILVSNIVYFIFWLILIYIALMNIIGRWNDYEIKKQLPKFIVGILIVPFSWFIIQFVLSLSSVLAAAVLSLPIDTFKDFKASKAFFDNTKLCTDITVDLWWGSSSQSWNWQKNSSNSFKCGDGWEITVAELFWKSGDSIKDEGFYGIMSIYTFGILKIDSLNSVSVSQIGQKWGITNLLNLWVKAIMDAVFVVVYLILLFALFLALFLRWVQLWIYMMISPLFWLFYYFGGSIGKLGKLSDFNLKNFISLAMLPVYVAAALSFGLILIAVVDYGATTSGKDSILKDCTQDKCVMEVGGMKINIKWATGKNTNSSGGNNGTSIETNPLGYLIMQLFAIVVLWMSVMAALNSSRLTSSIVAPFQHFGEHVGQAAMKLPTQIPIPMPGGWSLSASSLSDLSGRLWNFMEEKTARDTRDFAKQHWFEGIYGGSNETAEKIVRELKNGTATQDRKSEMLQNLIWTVDFWSLKSSEKEAFKGLWIDVSQYGNDAKKIKEAIIQANRQSTPPWTKIEGLEEKLDWHQAKPKPTETPQQWTPIIPTWSKSDDGTQWTITNIGSQPITVEIGSLNTTDKAKIRDNAEFKKLQNAIKWITDEKKKPTKDTMVKALWDAGIKGDIAQAIADGLQLE